MSFFSCHNSNLFQWKFKNDTLLVCAGFWPHPHIHCTHFGSVRRTHTHMSFCAHKCTRTCTSFQNKFLPIFFKLNSQFFFETGAMATPTKLRNSIVLSQWVPASTQWSQPSRFCHWRPLFDDNGYPPYKSNTQTNSCS